MLAAATAVALAIVIQDGAPLRAAPRNGAPTNALLLQGETVEVRGERLEYLQIYDYKRERGGFVLASQVQRIRLKPEEAPELLAIVRFLRLRPGAEALGIGFAAAYIEAASAEVLASEVGIEALDALGSFAERLADRASGARLDQAAQARLAGHLDVAARYGVAFINNERNGRVRICYEGEAFRRVLAMQSSPEQRARAALALTRTECMPGELRPLERRRMDEWRAQVLERVEPAALPGYLGNRIHMRRAAVWASLSYLRARQGEAAQSAATRALSELAAIDKTQLGDDDARTYNDAAMQVSASRWAAVPAGTVADAKRPHIVTAAGQAGETCVLLVDAKNDVRRPLARRCTYGLVWAASATLNREGTSAALAVQPTETWRELWVFRKSANGWSVRVLPPAAATPHIGYAEFAGWIPGGRQMLVAREARGDGKYRRSFEVLRLDTLTSVSQSPDPSGLRPFQRWQDAAWKSQSVSLR
jgi:hypothetical protein